MIGKRRLRQLINQAFHCILMFCRRSWWLALNKRNQMKVFCNFRGHNVNWYWKTFGLNVLYYEHLIGPSTSAQLLNSKLHKELPSHNYIWRIHFQYSISRCNDLRLKEILNETKTLRIDLLEMSLLETLILCRNGEFRNSMIFCRKKKLKELPALEYALSGQQLQQIDRFSTNALLTLGYYTMQRLDWSRFGRLLLHLRSLSLKSFETSLDQLFSHIINQIIDSEWKCQSKCSIDSIIYFENNNHYNIVFSK